MSQPTQQHRTPQDQLEDLKKPVDEAGGSTTESGSDESSSFFEIEVDGPGNVTEDLAEFEIEDDDMNSSTWAPYNTFMIVNPKVNLGKTANVPNYVKDIVYSAATKSGNEQHPKPKVRISTSTLLQPQLSITYATSFCCSLETNIIPNRG